VASASSLVRWCHCTTLQKRGIQAGASQSTQSTRASRHAQQTARSPCETRPGGVSGFIRTLYSWEMAGTLQVTHPAATALRPGRCRMMCDAIRWRTSPATTAATPAPLRSPRRLRTVCEGRISGMSMHAAAVCGCFCWRSAGNTVPADAAALPARVAEHFRQERPATCLFCIAGCCWAEDPLR